MVIQKGEPWGRASVADDAWPVAHSDSEFASQGRDHPVRLSGGNLYRALGSPAVPQASDACTILPVDSLRCVITSPGHTRVVEAVSDVRMGRWWGRHGMRILTNGGLLDARNIAPRAHPNDGEWDLLVLDSSMPLRQRAAAWKRALTGTHVPHPDIHLTRVGQCSFPNTGGLSLVIDGADMGDWQTLDVSVLPDFREVCV